MQNLNRSLAVAHLCLKQSPRLYDVVSIVLISAGVNVVTGAGGAAGGVAELIAFLSGVALAACGVLVLGMKNHSETVLRMVQSGIKSDKNRVRQNARDGGAAAGDALLPAKEVRTAQQHYTAAITYVLDKLQPARSIVLRLIFVLLLLFGGMIGAYLSLLVTEDARTTQAVEALTRSYHQDVCAQITDLRWQVAALSTAATNADKSLTTIQDATSAGDQRVVLEIGRIRNELAALNADQRRAIEDATRAGNQKLVLQIDQIKNELAALLRAISDQGRAGDRGSTIVPHAQPAKN